MINKKSAVSNEQLKRIWCQPVKQAIALVMFAIIAGALAYQFRVPSTIEIGPGDELAVRGFHAAEKDGDGVFRWTTGDGQVVFADPGLATPTVLRVRARAWRYQDTVFAAAVTINGHEAGSINKTGWREWSFRVDDSSLLRADQLTVGFQSTPFVLSDLYPESQDDLARGIAVDWVRLEPQWNASTVSRGWSDLVTIPSLPRLALLVLVGLGTYVAAWALGATATARFGLACAVIVAGAIQIAIARVNWAPWILSSLVGLGLVTVIDHQIVARAKRVVEESWVPYMRWARAFGITLNPPDTFVSPLMKAAAFTLVAVFMAWYFALGFYTQLGTFASNSVPDGMHEDFRIYERSFTQALEGTDPYGIRAIGEAFLYPPPALFVLAPFASIPAGTTRVAAYAALNLLLLCLMLWGISRHYGYSLRAVWWWFPLAFGFAPFLELLHLGQINLLTSFGMFLLFVAESRLPFLAGAGLSLAIVTKVSPLVFLGYLAAGRSRRTLSWTLVFLAGALVASAVTFGWGMLNTYLDTFSSLSNSFMTGTNSQALVTVAYLWNWMGKESWQDVQRWLYIYLAVVFAVSGLCAFLMRQREPLFIIVSLGTMVAPNVMWYHHYVFVLLPLFVWIAWSRFHPTVALWSIVGLVAIQVDRWYWTYGLMPHLFVHLSILVILMWQAIQVIRAKKDILKPRCVLVKN